MLTDWRSEPFAPEAGAAGDSSVIARAAAHLVSLIRDGEYGPGDRLPTERKLAESLQISRASVREALRLLEARGHIRIRPNSGSFVDERQSRANDVLLLDDRRPAAILEACQLIEPMVAELAALRRDDAGIEYMKRMHQADIEGVRARLPRRGRMVGFHLAIASAAHNPVLEDMVRTLNAQIDVELWDRLRSAHARFVLDQERSLFEHERILTAIENGRADVAREAMAEHLASNFLALLNPPE